MHGGAVYPDNGSSGWDIYANVFEDVFHWAFVWDSTGRMNNMRFRDSFTDSWLITNHAAAFNVSFVGNTYVNISGHKPGDGSMWPPPARAIMARAGTPPGTRRKLRKPGGG